MKHRLLTTLTAALLALSSWAINVTINGIDYKLNSTYMTATVVYDYYQGDIVIPSYVIYNHEIYYVTSINGDAFWGCTRLTSVTIGNSVTSIESEQFKGCTGLTSITIGNSVTTIGEKAFADCTGLTSITFGNSVTTIGDFAFADCTSLTSITIPNSVTTIGNLAFDDCTGLTSITIGNSVTSIGEEAFDDCTGLTSINIPNSVTSIGNYAFEDCTGLTSVTVDKGNNTYDSRDNCNAIIETASNTLIAGCMNTIIPESVTTIGDGAFIGCPGLTSVTIPNSVTTIGSDAFRVCTGLTSVTINSNNIVSKAYSNSLNLSNIFGEQVTTYILGDNVTSIGDRAFYDGTSLTSITIPNSVTSIGVSAFYHCTGLTSITIPNSVTSIGNEAFYRCTGLTSITIPNSVTSIGSSAFGGCTGLTSITIPESVTTIGRYAFSGCTGLTTVTINSNDVVSKAYTYDSNLSHIFGSQVTTYILGDNVTSIGDYAFYYCTRLTSITIGNSVTTIGIYAFDHCTGLTSITIPNSVTTIGGEAFYGCTGLTSITIGNSVTTISIYAFEGCTGLTSVTINSNNLVSRGYPGFIFGNQVTTYILGDNVITIGEDAFNDCTGLTSITIPNSVTSIEEGAFGGCTGLTSITIPNSVTSIGQSAFSGCTGLTSITIPNSVTSIGWGAFGGCTGLTSITIGNSVTTIGAYAFRGCTGLTSVTINSNNIVSKAYTGYYFNLSSIFGSQVTTYILGDNVTSIGKYAFSYCTGLTSITIGNSVTTIGDYAFKGCTDLTSVTINSNDLVSNAYTPDSTLCNKFGEQVTTYILGDNVTSIGEFAFYNCTNLTSINIPSSVTAIGEYAFRGCEGLTSVSIPSSVTTIGEYAFNSCSLSSLNLPEGLTEIGRYAFAHNSIQEIRLPASVVKLGDNPFCVQRDANGNNCLQRIVVAEGNPAYEVVGGVLYTKGLTEIVCFPSNDATSYTMPTTLRRIGASAFTGSKVRDVYFTSSVIEGQGASGLSSDAAEMNFYVDDLAVFCRFNPIDDYDDHHTLYTPWPAFNLYHKGSLVTDLIIPEGIDTLCTMAFSRCKSIRSVTFPSTFRYTRQYTFWDCPNLKRVVLNEGLEGLGVFSFLRSPLQEIHAPMRKPWSFSFPGDDVGISDWLHQHCFGNPNDTYSGASTYSEATLFVPNGCVETYRNTEGWNAFKAIYEESEAYGENVYPTNVYRGTDGKSSYYVVTTTSADGSPQLYVVRESPDGSKYAIMSADEVQFDADIASVTATETENSFLGPKQSVSLTLHLLKNKARLDMPNTEGAEGLECTRTSLLPLARTTYNSQDQFGPAFEMLDDSTARIVFPNAEDAEEASVSYQNERAEWTFTGKQSGKVLKVSANSQCQLTATDRGFSYLFLPESSPAPLERYAEGTYSSSFFTALTGDDYTYSATLYRNRLNDNIYVLKPFIDNEEGIALTLTDEENEDGYRIVDVTPAKTGYEHPTYGMIWAEDAVDYGIDNTRSYFDGRTFFLNLAYYVSAGYFDAFVDTFTLNIPEGDLNGDYTVNVGDVTTLVNMILDKMPMSDDADLNGDGSVNVGDVTTLVNQILGKYPSRAAYHRPTNKTMQTSVGMRCYVIQPALSHRTAEPQRGQLVVVRRADGTSRKMYVR